MGKRLVIKVSLWCMVCLTFILTGCEINIGGCGHVKHERVETLSVAIAEWTTLDVETDVGAIRIVGADVEDCSIIATIRGKETTMEEAKKLAEQVTIKADTVGNKLMIRAESSIKKCISVEYEITAPKKINAWCKTDVGAINVSRLAGEITAKTDVGAIKVEGAVGKLELETDVGSVTVKFAEDAPAVCYADIETDVGKINFTSPPNMSARLEAKTDVGDINTNMPVTVTGKVGKHIHGTVGNGEGKVYLKTNVGAIHIK